MMLFSLKSLNRDLINNVITFPMSIKNGVERSFQINIKLNKYIQLLDILKYDFRDQIEISDKNSDE